MRLLLLLLCLAFPRASSCGDACEQRHQWLWRVRGRSAPALFFGTLHVARSEVRVAGAAVQGLDAADRVLFELDLTDPRTARRMAHCQRLPHGLTLSDVLPGDLYLRLKRHLDYLRNPGGWGDLYPDYLFKAGGWERRRPVWALLLLESLAGGGGGGEGEVLDLWLARRAGRRAGAVERPEEHCLPLNALEPTQVEWALNRSLSRLEAGGPPPGHDLIRRYNCGDAEHLAATLSSGEGEVERYFRRELLEKRNARMAQRVLRLLREHPRDSFFFAFGAGHFLGEGSVLELLSKEGFQVEQVDVSPTHSPRHHQPKHRHFNDLWVKMDDRTPEEEEMSMAGPSSAGGLVLDPLLWLLVTLAAISC